MELCFNEMTVMKNGTLPEDIALCAQAGFSAVELRKGTLLRYLRGGGTLEALRQTLEEQHVRAASLNALESVSFQTKAGGRMLRELSDWCFAACRVLGCGCMEVIASFHVPEGTSAAAICRETADSLLRLSDAAADYGVRLALEFMAVPDSSVQTFAQCAEILDTVDRANVGMLLDTWHFCAGGSRPEELSALRGDRLFMVHVSDCPARAPFTAQRAESYWPGEGDEKIWVDDETFPSHFGTGVEDYYSFCGYFRYLSPFGGEPRLDNNDFHAYNNHYRMRALDGIPFNSKLRFDLEMEGHEAGRADISNAIFWYGDAATRAVGFRQFNF